MKKLKFLSECSTDALKEIFDPEYMMRLNCSLAEAILRNIFAELLERGIKMDLDNSFLRNILIGDMSTDEDDGEGGQT